MDEIPKQSTNVIAEIAQAHDGSLGILHSFIDAIAPTGVDCIKFQMHIAEAESSEFDQFRIPFSRVDKTRFDYWKRMEFTNDEWKEIKDHCESLGCEFLCTPFSLEAFYRLEALGVSRYKIGSGDLSNLALLQAVGTSGKTVILSSGMSNLTELDEAVHHLKHVGAEFSIMQCTSEYPVPPERWGLNVLGELRGRYGVPIGFSDHSGTSYASLAATAIGAELIEIHVTFDRRMFGPDASSSITIDELKYLVEGVRAIDKAKANPVTKSGDQYARMRQLFGRSLAVNRAINRGEEISFSDLETKKPAGHGVPAGRFADVVGKKVVRDIPKWGFIKKDDVQ